MGRDFWVVVDIHLVGGQESWRKDQRVEKGEELEGVGVRVWGLVLGPGLGRLVVENLWRLGCRSGPMWELGRSQDPV